MQAGFRHLSQSFKIMLLWQTSVMANKVNFAQAIALGFKNFARFRGVASRTEYWYFFLFTFLVRLVLSTVDSVLIEKVNLDLWIGLADVANLVFLIPSLALVVRRFRDAGVSGWWVASAAIPVTMLIAAVVLALSDPAFQDLIAWAQANQSATQVEIQAKAYEVGQKLDPTSIWLLLGGFLCIIAYVIFELVIKVQPSKSRQQGNKYVAEQQSGISDH